MSAIPNAVPDEIRAHCELVHNAAAALTGRGKLAVCCFGEDPEKLDPKTGKSGRRIPPKIAHFEVGDVVGMARCIVKMGAEAHRNVYLSLAVLRPDLPPGKKGFEADIVGVLGIVADFDDPEAAHWADRLPLPPDYVLATSAGRFQAFYILDKPYPVEEAKPIAQLLKTFARCDHGTMDLSHVWRIPGTPNWPNAQKIAAGRPPEPQQARVAWPWNGHSTSLAALSAALTEAAESETAKSLETDAGPQDPSAEVSVELLVRQLPPKLRRKITEPSRGDRSKVLFAVIKALGERSFDALLIERIIRAYPAGISEKYADRDDLDMEIARVLSKPSQDRPAAPHWHAELIASDGDKPRSNLANAITALRLAPEWQGVLAFNTFRQKIVMQGKPPWMLAAPSTSVDWEGVDEIRTADWLQHQGIFVQPRTAGQAARVVAHLHEFHPVVDYLNTLTWDGQRRLDTWAIVYLGAEDTPYVRAVGRRFLIGAIARIVKPGCKADCAVILEGPQGTYKSTAARTLMPEASWFTDEIAELGTKDAALQLLGRWIVEWSELDSMKRSEVSRLKAYMSRASDNFRPPYEATVKDHPRSCCFFGTSNEDEYLRDQTGGRRFWPIRCGTIDIPALQRDRDQLWAEALHYFTQGDNWWLDTPELNTLAREEQAARREPDPWEPHIEGFVSGKEEITVKEILSDACLGIPIERQDQRSQNRVAACLKELGWQRGWISAGPRRGDRCYHAPEPVDTVDATVDTKCPGIVPLPP